MFSFGEVAIHREKRLGKGSSGDVYEGTQLLAVRHGRMIAFRNQHACLHKRMIAMPMECVFLTGIVRVVAGVCLQDRILASWTRLSRWLPFILHTPPLGSSPSDAPPLD